MKLDRAIVVALVCGGILPACASNATPPPTDGGGFFRCTTVADCDDGQACTVDQCAAGNMCTWTSIHAMCPAGQMCSPFTGCSAEERCTGSTAGECDDSHACTIDSCNSSFICDHMPVDALCTDPSAPMCDPTMGCIAGTGCTSSAMCADEHACTVDTCGADRTCSHMPIHSECPSGQMCSVTRGCYTPMPCDDAADCQDGNFCNGAEICTTEFGCQDAPMPRMCNDSEACTVDTCDATTDACVFRCDPTLGTECAAMCPPPAAGCNGMFNCTGTTSVGCSSCTRVDWSQATFTVGDGQIEVRPRSYSTTPPLPGGLVLIDDVEPLCPMFDATVEVGGGCTERYGIAGMFTDDDHFTATVTWQFIDMDGISCLLCGCSDGSTTIMGTRIP